MSDSDDMDLGDLDMDLGDDDILDLGLDDDKFDLDGDGGFFLGEATKALDAAFEDIGPSPAKPKTAAPAVAASDNFLSRLLADREAEINTIREQPAGAASISGGGGLGDSGGTLTRKKSVATLEAVASSVRSMAHLSLKRPADGGVGGGAAARGLAKTASSADMLDATLAGRGVDPFASTMRDDEAITDEEYTEVDLGRRKLKLLLQRFVRDYREHLTGRIMVPADGAVSGMATDNGYGSKFTASARRRSTAASREEAPSSMADGSALSCGEFELFKMVWPTATDGTAASPPRRTLAEVKQTLKDVCKAQEARLSKVKSLLQDGEGGLTDPMFVRPARREGHMAGSINAGGNASPSPSRHAFPSALAASPSATAFTATSFEDRAREMYPSSSDDDLANSLSLSLAADSDEEEAKEKSKEEKKERRKARDRQRREAVSKMKIDAITAGGGAAAVSDDGGPMSPNAANLGETSAGLRNTLEAMGFGNPHASPDDLSSDIRGLAYAMMEQLLFIHEDILSAITEASDFSKAPQSAKVSASPLRKIGLGSKSDDFTGSVDAALQQGWELLFMCLNAARELPLPDFVFPQTLEKGLSRLLVDWRGTYQLASLFGLKFAIAINAKLGLSLCAPVLSYADAFQSRTIETAMVCVAEEALDGTLKDSIVWIGPILAVMRMLGDNPAGVNEDLLVLALDVLMFAVLGAGNAAMQFVAEGGLAVLADVLRAIDPSVIKPEVTKRILKLLNPTSLGVKPHAFLTPEGERSAQQTPKKRGRGANKKASTPQPRDAADGHSPLVPDVPMISVGDGEAVLGDAPRKGEADGEGHADEGGKAAVVGVQPLSVFAFPVEENTPLRGITQAESHSHSMDDVTRELMGLEADADDGEMNSTAALPTVVELSEDDYRDIIYAIGIALEKYDGQDEERNSAAQREADQLKADAVKHKQSEAQNKAQATARRRGSITVILPSDASASGGADEDASLPLLPPSAADNQVLDECTFIVYAIMMVAIDVAVNESVMQLLARHVVGSDVFWNNKQTMRGVLGCVQTLVTNYHAYEAYQAAAAQSTTSMGGGLAPDASILLEGSTVSASSPYRSSARGGGAAGRQNSSAAAYSTSRMARSSNAVSTNTPGYYRVIMDPPTLAVLSLAVRCYSDVEITRLPHVASAYKALYQLVSAEPARLMLVGGCPDTGDEEQLAQSTPTRAASMRRRVSIAVSHEGDKQHSGEHTPSGRRTSLSKGLNQSSTPPPPRPSANGSGGGGGESPTPPYNALIPCLLYTLTRTSFIHQKRYTLSLLNKVIKGAYRPACLQLLGVLPVGIIFQPPLHQGRRSRGSVAFKRGAGGESPSSLHLAALQAAAITSPRDRGGAGDGFPLQRPGLGGISSGAIATRLEAHGAFLRFISKFVGTAPPELIPPLLALIREIGRFLSHSSVGDVFDQQLVYAILRSTVSIIQNYDQEVAVVAGGCMALAHLCRIPHGSSQTSVAGLNAHSSSGGVVFHPSRFASSMRSLTNNSSSAVDIGESAAVAPAAADPVTAAGDPAAAAEGIVPPAAEADGQAGLTGRCSAEGSGLALPVPVHEGGMGTSYNMAISPSSPGFHSSMRGGALLLSVGTPTLLFALENEPLLDMAIGFINGQFIVNAPAGSGSAPSAASGAAQPSPGTGSLLQAPGGSGGFSRRPSMQHVFRGDAEPASSSAKDGSLAPLGPSPVVRRTLAYLLAVVACDADSAQSIADEGGLALLQEAAGVRPPGTSPSAPKGGYTAPFSPEKGRDSSTNTSLSRKGSMLRGVAHAAMVAAQQREEALAALLTREEKELCKRQYHRLLREQQKNEAPASAAVPVSRPATAAGLSTVVDDFPRAAAQLTLEATVAMGSVREEERTFWDMNLRVFERELDGVSRLLSLQEGQRRKERADLEAYQMDTRRGIENFANDAFLDLMRYAQASVQKKLTRAAMSPSYGGAYLDSMAGSPLRAATPLQAGSPPAGGSGSGGGGGFSASTLARLPLHQQPSSSLYASGGPGDGEMPLMMQSMLAAMAKMQEQQMKMQAEMLLAVQQGSLMASQRPSSPSQQPQYAMASLATAPLPPRPQSASLRPSRVHPPPTFSPRSTLTSATQRYADSSRPHTPSQGGAGGGGARPHTPHEWSRPSTPHERASAALNSIQQRREAILTPRRPASSPIGGRGAHHHRPPSSHGGAGAGDDLLSDSFIREDNDGDDNAAFETPRQQHASVPMVPAGGGVGSGSVKVPTPPPSSSHRPPRPSAVNALAANAKAEELVALLMCAADAHGGLSSLSSEGPGGSTEEGAAACDVPPRVLRLTASFQQLTVLDLSRNYLGDHGLGQLVEMLSLHRLQPPCAAAGAPMVLPHLASLSLRHNGLTGLHLPALLFEGLGVPQGMHVHASDPWTALWASPRPSAAYVSAVAASAACTRGRRGSTPSAPFSYYRALSLPGLAHDTAPCPWLAECGDAHAAAVVEGVADFLLFAVDEALARGRSRAPALKEEEEEAAGLAVALPCDYVVIEGVRTLLGLADLSSAVQRVVGRPVTLSLLDGEGGCHSDDETQRQEGGGAGEIGIDALLERLRSARHVASQRARQLESWGGAGAEESPFYRPITLLDLSHNIGITPRCNRDLIAYARLNPFMLPLAVPQPVTPPSTAVPPPTAPSSAPSGGVRPKRPLSARRLSDATAGRTAAYYADPAKATCPLVLDGTSLFDSSVELIASAVAQRGRRGALVREGLSVVFAYYWPKMPRPVPMEGERGGIGTVADCSPPDEHSVASAAPVALAPEEEEPRRAPQCE